MRRPSVRMTGYPPRRCAVRAALYAAAPLPMTVIFAVYTGRRRSFRVRKSGFIVVILGGIIFQIVENILRVPENFCRGVQKIGKDGGGGQREESGGESCASDEKNQPGDDPENEENVGDHFETVRCDFEGHDVPPFTEIRFSSL